VDDVCLDNLADGGYLSFVAPNSWISNSGASIFRDKVLADGELVTFVDFEDFKVFEDAGIQTMIFVFKKCTPRTKYTVNYAKVEDKNLSLENIKLLLSSKLTVEIEGIKKFPAEIEPTKLIGKNLSFVDEAGAIILDKIERGKRWFLDRKEVAQGIVAPQEFVTERHLESSNIQANPNDGIFQLKTQEKENLNLSSQELELMKPFYTTDQLGRYVAEPQNDLWVIYTKSDIKDKIENFPNIKQHLERFTQIITSDYKPYGLHRARDERFFVGDKIISLRKCIEPTFSFVDFDCYVSQTYYVIKTKRVNLKFLIGVLNSKIVAFWLRYKGKMQGDLYQVDKEPLLNIPIPTATIEQQTQIAELVDKIIELKKTFQNLVNIFVKLITAKYKPTITSTKLKTWYNLETSEFLDELKKQKAQIGGLANEVELMTYFESEKVKVLELERLVESWDGEVEGLVRGLYGFLN
jgi:adenine-specific DNA-methyltransferase